MVANFYLLISIGILILIASITLLAIDISKKRKFSIPLLVLIIFAMFESGFAVFVSIQHVVELKSMLDNGMDPMLTEILYKNDRSRVIFYLIIGIVSSFVYWMIRFRK